ncbi:MAG: hypothetical protein AB9903_09600 [Vulcanimicrobiota bacterium]
MKLKEYFTEEPFDIPGVNIPCCIGDYMDIRDNDPSSLAWDEDTVEGYHYCACRRVHHLKEGEPLCDLDAVDDFAEKISTRSMDRHDAAQEADEELDVMLQKRRKNDLRLGEVLTLFKKKKGEDYLGHRSIGTFAVEHLDFSGRLASELMHNHEIFSALQLTKEAFRQGEISKSALRHLSKVLTAEMRRSGFQSREIYRSGLSKGRSMRLSKKRVWPHRMLKRITSALGAPAVTMPSLLLTLKIEGTSPHNLTFTFGPRSHGDEKPFLKYVRGRKVLTDRTVQSHCK